MSDLANYREQKRRDAAERAEQARRDREVAAEQARKDREADREFELRKAKLAADQARKDREAAEKRKAERQEKRCQRRAELLETLTENKVALSIYGLALVSLLMSAPAMAEYGHKLYGASAWPWTGWLLPIVTEISMWACAFAVHHRRVTQPGASVFWLQVGVGLSTALAAALNAMKGFHAGVDASVVMGVVSVAGVLLHQMTVAGQPRSREQKAADRIARQIARKEFDARRAAIRDAKVEITADGTAQLVFEPGVYRVGRPRNARLAKVSPALDKPGPRDRMDDEIAALIDAEIAAELARESIPGGVDEGDEDAPGGGVATLDRPAPESTPKQQKSSGNGGRRGVRLGGRQSRSLDELRAELERLVQAGEVDPRYTESIRKGLRCAKPTAKRLRDEHLAEGER